MSDIATHKITITLPADPDDTVLGGLFMGSEDFALATTINPAADHPAQLEWLMAGTPQEEELTARLALLAEITGWSLSLTDIQCTALPDIDWLAASYQAPPAFTIGRFYIAGTAAALTECPAGHHPLYIEAVQAFGSGEHGTTAGCLKALHDLAQGGFQPHNILDLGTGSGILALAARTLWPDAAILATDIEEAAIHSARQHCAANNIDDITCLHSDGFAAPEIAQTGPYDLIIANILAAPLKEMADDLTRALAPTGRALLSGMLTGPQAESVLARTATAGLPVLYAHYDEGEWHSAVIGR